MNWTQIKTLRETAGISQRQIAQFLGIPVTTYNTLEKSADREDLKAAALEFVKHQHAQNDYKFKLILEQG
jgi:DNA-binding XRE family transcriptional regulator